MSRSVTNKTKKLTTVAGDNFTEAMDITNVNGASFMYEGVNGQTGNITIQKSNKSAGPWFDTAFTSAMADEKAIVEANGLQTAFVRLKVNISNGIVGDAEVTALGKEG